MTADERDRLRAEWRRLQSVDAKVVELRRLRQRGHGHIARWLCTVESALGRRATVTATAADLAIRQARRRLGYRDAGRVLALDAELPVQTTFS